MNDRPAAQIRPDVRYAWRGPSLLVVNPPGECGADFLTGFYFREARHLSHLHCEIQGETPFLCATGDAGPNELDFVYIHPELHRFGGGGSGLSGQEDPSSGPGEIAARSIDIRTRYRVHPASFEIVQVLTNRSPTKLAFDVTWSFGADFADLIEVHGGGGRAQSAAVEVVAEASQIHFIYGHPSLPLRTEVRASGRAAWRSGGSRLTAGVTLEPQESVELVLEVVALDAHASLGAADGAGRERRLSAWEGGLARLSSPRSETLPEMVNMAMRDLGSMALLEGEEDEWLAPAAGMPIYPALFGRDALTASWQASLFDSGELLDASLTRLGRLQGTREDGNRDEEPGRIIQQARMGPLARLGANPFDRYYGDYASPLVFLIALGQLYACTGQKKRIERHWDVALRILEWAQVFGDADGDGYLEYSTMSPHGPVHQGWKDSGDAIVYEDGRGVGSPTAVCEVQGYWYVAQQIMAVLSAAMGDRRSARAHWRSAKSLKARFNRDFWLEDEGFIALALDPEKRVVRSIASNAGHCLATGIVADEHVPRLVQRLFQPDLFSGWGIRTLSTAHPSYSPLSYHRGSVWPVENGTILFGLRRYGFEEETVELARALIDLARLFPRQRTPECVGGYARTEFPHPGAYPRANAPQAWNQSVPAIVVQALLGMYPVAPLHLLIVDPILPEWLPELVVRDLRVGGATVSLRFYRDGAGVSHVETLEKQGTLRIVRQPPPDDLSAGVGDRVRALFRDRLPF